MCHRVRERTPLLSAILLLTLFGFGCTVTTEFTSNPPGAKIEADGAFVGTTPVTLTWEKNIIAWLHPRMWLFGWAYYDVLSRMVIVKAIPSEGGQFVQTKIFYQGQSAPKKVFFDMRLRPVGASRPRAPSAVSSLPSTDTPTSSTATRALPPASVPSSSASVYFNVGAGHWIRKVIDRGRFVELEDRSLWEVSSIDRIDSMLWLVADPIVVVESDTGLLPYKLVNTDNGDAVEAKLIRR